MNTETVKKLADLGGNEWQKNGKHRVYFNGEAICNLIDLKVTTYKSGNISSATLQGDAISNAEAKRILDSADDLRLYVDDQGVQHKTPWLAEYVWIAREARSKIQAALND